MEFALVMAKECGFNEGAADVTFHNHQIRGGPRSEQELVFVRLRTL